MATDRVGLPDQLTARFAAAVAELGDRFASDPGRLADDNQDAEVRAWLDGDGPSLA